MAKVNLVLLTFDNAVRPVGIGFAVIEGAGPGAVGNRTYRTGGSLSGLAIALAIHSFDLIIHSLDCSAHPTNVLFNQALRLLVGGEA